VTHFLNCGTPSVTFERAKLDSSFFLCNIGHGEYYQMCDECPLRGRGQGHVTHFLNFGTRSITFERVKLEILALFYMSYTGYYCYYYYYYYYY